LAHFFLSAKSFTLFPLKSVPKSVKGFRPAILARKPNTFVSKNPPKDEVSVSSILFGAVSNWRSTFAATSCAQNASRRSQISSGSRFARPWKILLEKLRGKKCTWKKHLSPVLSRADLSNDSKNSGQVLQNRLSVRLAEISRDLSENGKKLYYILLLISVKGILHVSTKIESKF